MSGSGSKHVDLPLDSSPQHSHFKMFFLLPMDSGSRLPQPTQKTIPPIADILEYLMGNCQKKKVAVANQKVMFVIFHEDIIFSACLKNSLNRFLLHNLSGEVKKKKFPRQWTR